MTPLERTIAALEKRIMSTKHGHRREGMEYALALCRSFEDYDPEHDMDMYCEGFADAKRIYTTGINTIAHETKAHH
jgi:hypothetical protein